MPQCPQYCELSPYGLVDRLVPDIMAEHHEDILHTFHLGKSFDSRGNLGLLWNQKIDDQQYVAYAEILKVVSAVNTLVLFFCPCCANFWSVYAHRMCIGAYFWLQLC